MDVKSNLYACDKDVLRILYELSAPHVSIEEQEVLLDQLLYFLTDPFLIIYSRILPPNHPVLLDSQIICDAFEAVSNGMAHAWTFTLLDEMKEDSVLIDWKYLTLGLHHFYKQDFTAAGLYLQKISIKSPCYILSENLIGTMNGSSSPVFEPLEKNLFNRKQWLNENLKYLEESIAHHWDSIFYEVSEIIAQELASTPQLQARFLLYALGQSDACEFSAQPMLSFMKKNLGQTETFRLRALSLLAPFPDISLLFWLQTLLLQIEELTPLARKTYIDLIKKLAQSLPKEALDAPYKEGLQQLLFSLTRGISLQSLGIEQLVNFLDKLFFGVLPPKKRATKRKNPSPFHESSSKTIQQLELFSEEPL